MIIAIDNRKDKGNQNSIVLTVISEQVVIQ